MWNTELPLQSISCGFKFATSTATTTDPLESNNFISKLLKKWDGHFQRRRRRFLLHTSGLAPHSSSGPCKQTMILSFFVILKVDTNHNCMQHWAILYILQVCNWFKKWTNHHKAPHQFSWSFCMIKMSVLPPYRSLLASLSDSRSVSTSPSLTGPFTFLMMERLLSSMKSTRTWNQKRVPPILSKYRSCRLLSKHNSSSSVEPYFDCYDMKGGGNISFPVRK